jgi:hypothetical protein
MVSPTVTTGSVVHGPRPAVCAGWVVWAVAPEAPNSAAATPSDRKLFFVIARDLLI